MYTRRIVGQEKQLKLVADTVCQHISYENHRQPLVMLLTGDPDTSKTLTATMTAQVRLERVHRGSSGCQAFYCGLAR